MGKEGRKKKKFKKKSHFGFPLHWYQSLAENKMTEKAGSGSSALGLSQAD